MKIGLSLPTMLPGLDRDTVLSWCRRIEDDGYDTIGFGERIAYHNLEIFSVLSAAAAVTERVRDRGDTVVVVPLHAAAWVAKSVATLDVLSGGRRDPRVSRWAVVTRTTGRSGVIRRGASLASTSRSRRSESLWAGAPPADGLDPIGPPPVQARIPILSGAMGPKSMRRSAVWADGIAGFEMDPSRDARVVVAGARRPVVGRRPNATPSRTA